MPTPSGLVTQQELIDAQLDVSHLGRVVNSKDASGAPISTSTNRTGGVNKTLDALEAEYEQSITTKEAEADTAIDRYRLLNKGPYVAGITLDSKFEYITYNGESYFPVSPPYTTTSTTPDADTNLFVGAYASTPEVTALVGAGDSQIFEGNIWPVDPTVSATLGDSGLSDVKGLRDAATGVIYRMTLASGGGDVAVSGDITSLDFTAKTAVIGGLSLRLYRKLKQFGCAIRNTGSGWAFIADSAHRPVGFSGISTTPAGAIQLDYDFTASRVVTLSVAMDETYAKQGIIAGASVGAAFATIELSADLEFLVDPQTGNVTAPSYWGSDITATPGSGSCNITHPATVTNGVATISPVGAVDLYRTDFTCSISPTVTSLLGTGDADGVIGYTGATWSYSGLMFNDPVMVWDNTNNKLDVTHDECDLFNLSIIPRNGGYITKVRDVSSTGFSVEFFDSAGNHASVESIQMNFIFVRKGRVRKENIEGVLGVRRGRAPVNANNLTEQFGNLWVSGFHEIDE